MTFWLAINQAKALAFDGALDFLVNFVMEKRIEVDCLDKVDNKDFIVNKSGEDNDQILTLERMVRGSHEQKMT